MSQLSRNHPFAFTNPEIDRIREVFKSAGFDEAGVSGALGVSGIPQIRDVPAEIAYKRTAQDAPLNTLVRLFVMGIPGNVQATSGTFQTLSINRLIEGGLLVEKDEKLYASVKITPIDGLLIAFDRTWQDEKVEASDHVMGPSDSARLIAGMVINPGEGEILDVGAGCGYLTFLAAKNNKRVVATDVNPRAAGFVDFNARLNGITNVEATTGDLFQPVAGDKFDLIISNPPFVISPEDRLVYLNGGMKADAFCQRMAAEVPSFLREGGYFQMLCNWVENTDADWQPRLQTWFAGSGCDTWVLRSSTTDPVSYAINWMKHGHNDASSGDATRLDTWLEYYKQEKVGAIGAGIVIMRKRSGDGNWFRSFDGPGKIAGRCGEEVLERMQALDFMARGAVADKDLLKSVFQIASKARLTQECQPSEEGWSLTKASIQITQGFAYIEEIDDYFAELLIHCDGKRTLQASIETTAMKLGINKEDIPAETCEIVRQLVDEGFLRPIFKAKP